jgi:hypothetical protein
MFIFEIYRQIFSELKIFGEAFSYSWFIILPLLLYYLFKLIWLDYIRFKFLLSIEYTLLEIIPPHNIEKSPKPMESLYWGISGVLKTFNTREEFIQGMLTFRFSFELVGDEKGTHFYVRTPKNFRHLVEAHLYAQYPDVIINEVPDYVSEVPIIVPNKEWELWGADFEFVKPDPYPIRTFRFFEEDITGKMIDPLAGLVETAGKLKPGQKIWLQYIVVPEPETWENTGRALVQELAGRIKKRESALGRVFQDLADVLKNIWNGIFGTVEFAAKEEAGEEQPLEFRLTPGEKEVLKAVENNLGKNVFKVKMRFLYLGRKENFDKTVVSAFVGGIKQFNDINLNSFKPNDKSKTYANYLFVNTRLRYRQRKIFRRYRDRDPSGVMVVLSTEELATIYHLPDMSVVAPGVTFVEAKRGGAPANLPVG